MDINLQYFGGRGGSSGLGGGSTGVSFTDSNGKQHNYYFYKGEGGKNYYSTSIGGQPKPTPNNMSHKEMVERLKQNTSNVKTISKAEKAKATKAYKEDRAATDRVLNQAYASDKHFTKGMKASRTGNRATRRK